MLGEQFLKEKDFTLVIFKDITLIIFIHTTC